MPKLSQIPFAKVAQHLLLIAHTKFGKSHYAAMAAKAGYELLYLDKDNGLTTIQAALADDPAAMDRVHYISPNNMLHFLEAFIDSRILRWNVREDKQFNRNSAQAGDEIIEIYLEYMGLGVIFVLDTWTSAALDALREKADELDADLTDMDKWGREIYGNAGFRMTQFANALQHAKFHMIVMAHSQIYEIKEKPPNKVAGEVKEKDMIIRDTLEVPTSTSAPHGAQIGKFFNQIAYITLNSANGRQIDYRTIKGRIGGGTPNAVLDINGPGSWVGTFGAPPPRAEDAPPWIRYITFEQFKLDEEARAANAPKIGSLFKNKLTPAVKQGVIQAAQTPSKPEGTT